MRSGLGFDLKVRCRVFTRLSSKVKIILRVQTAQTAGSNLNNAQKLTFVRKSVCGQKTGMNLEKCILVNTLFPLCAARVN